MTMEASPTVYVTQEDRYKNISQARQFGNLVTVFDQKYQVYVDSSEAVEIAEERLETFSPSDFILLIGDPILIGVAMAVASSRSPVVNALKWDRETRRYLRVSIDFNKISIMAKLIKKIRRT